MRDRRWRRSIGPEGESVGRKIVRLTVDLLAAIDAPCRRCLFWELDPVRRARVAPAEAAEEKEAWLSEVLRDWGSCGRVALLDDRPVGYVVYVPAALAPGASGLPTAPVSPDALLMTTAYVLPEARGGGLGRMLVQGMARDLIERGGFRAVEAFGDTRGGGRLSLECPQRCVLPAGFLGGVGFKTQRAHGTTPRLRMDLRSALTWRDEVELALDRLLGAVRPARPVSPETRRTGQ
jgi:GNAT superfamily N-acetyltransferase